MPRVKCPEHGVVTTTVPWAEPNSGFTALFEALVIDWLKEASTSAVARLMGLMPIPTIVTADSTDRDRCTHRVPTGVVFLR